MVLVPTFLLWAFMSRQPPQVMQRSIQEYMTLRLAMRDKPRPTQRVLPGLLSLPNELLAAIWKNIPRLDIESMSLVNRRIHPLGEEVITRHRRLKNRYRRGKNHRCNNASISHPVRHTTTSRDAHSSEAPANLEILIESEPADSSSFDSRDS